MHLRLLLQVVTLQILVRKVTVQRAMIVRLRDILPDRGAATSVNKSNIWGKGVLLLGTDLLLCNIIRRSFKLSFWGLQRQRIKGIFIEKRLMVIYLVVKLIKRVSLKRALAEAFDFGSAKSATLVFSLIACDFVVSLKTVTSQGKLITIIVVFVPVWSGEGWSRFDWPHFELNYFWVVRVPYGWGLFLHFK